MSDWPRFLREQAKCLGEENEGLALELEGAADYIAELEQKLSYYQRRPTVVSAQWPPRRVT